MIATANFVPVGERILVKPDEAETQSPGGIVLPDQSRSSANRGVVVAVGPGRYLDNGERLAMDVTEGDRVVFQKYSGVEVEIEGETYFAMTEQDLIAVIH